MGTSVAVSERINGVEELVIIAELDQRRLPTDEPSGEALDAFWAAAVKTVKGAVSEGHGVAVRAVVFVEPKSLEKTSSGKLRRHHYADLLQKGKLAVLHEDRLPG